MCVIAICEYARLTDEQVELMFDANKHGGGAAWREPDEDDLEKMVVKWSKGHTKEDMVKLNRELPFPYVLHFRVPSTGTSMSYLACHPFEINDKAKTGFAGATTGYVLFHNGFWADWKNKLQNIAIGGYLPIPSGPWSDSRGLAWAAHHLGIGFLDIVDEKVVAFGPNEDDIEVFGSWMILKNKDEKGEDQNILVSNKTWERTTVQQQYPGFMQGGGNRNHGHVPVNDRRNPNLPLLAAGVSPSEQAGGTAADAPSFRGPAQIARGEAPVGRSQQESVQKGTQEATRRAEEGSYEDLDSLVPCTGCGKCTGAGTLHTGQWFCWQCWAPKAKEEGKRAYVGTCSLCKTCTGAKIKYSCEAGNAGAWICITCWETNGKPSIEFAFRMAESIQTIEV